MAQRQATQAVDSLPIVIGAVIMAVLWYAKFSGAELWYDELQSVTFAARPLATALFSVIVYDPHPPLYYVFLHFWMAIFGQSDRLILASSLLLIALTGIAINLYCRRYFDRATAAVATLFFLVHPYALYWSGQARMYAAVMLFAVLFQHANAAYFIGDARGAPRRRLMWVVICGTALACLHNCGILFCGTIALYWLLRNRATPAERPVARLAPWLAAQGCVVLLSSPFVLHSLVEHLGHAERPNLAALAAAVASMTIGPEQLPEALIVVGAVATTIVLVGAARSAELRLAEGILVLFPILSFWLISNLVKPIWVADRLFAFIVPFFCIIAARLLTSSAGMPGRWRLQTGRFAAFAVGLMLVAAVAVGDRQILDAYEKPNDWRSAAALVRSYAPDGGTVEVDQVRDRWSLNWYLAGPGWDDGIQGAMIQALRAPSAGNLVKRLVAIRDAMERYETARSRGKYIVEAELAAHPQSNQPILVFTEHCPASEFWNIYLRDPKRQPEPDFFLKYQPLPPIKGLCGYVSRPGKSGNLE